MLNSNVALVGSSDVVSLSDLTTVAAALQVQVSRDCAPLWNIAATVTAFTSLADVPVGHWPIIVQGTIDEGVDGYHTDKNNQPLALVLCANNWSLVASHELIEMLVDPFGNRLVPGPSLDPAHPQNRVQYLLEACDPVEDAKYSYTINGVVVSDFVTPSYHDPADTTGARYDFTGAVTRPRQVLENGYINWLDGALGGWYQLTNFAGAPNAVRQLPPQAASAASLSAREYVHRASPLSQRKPRISEVQKAAFDGIRQGGIAASGAAAQQLNETIRSFASSA